ncbi:MAG: DEAD/DEAH box helicase [Methanomicrobiales archaeon]|nr:DEAD/DEAH box helicase [Methanomicrobiales archaeon]
MSHRLLDILGDTRAQALKQAEHIQVHREFQDTRPDADEEIIRHAAEVLEIVVLDLLLDNAPDNDNKSRELQRAAADSFRLRRVLPRPDDPIEAATFLLHTSALAVIGDMGADAARMLREEEWPELPLESSDWGRRTWATILDVWLRLIRKDGWRDRDRVLERVSALRDSQAEFEKNYLDNVEPIKARSSALELIGLYHLAKAAEIFALFTTDGVVDGKYQIQGMLDTHFDRALAVCEHSQMFRLEPLTHILVACSSRMVDNCIWTVTRAVNSRVTQFVKTLVDRGRGDRAIFDVLPPQRRALAEKGLLGSSRRAVVVSLPTSSGKTLIAEFRILQALNQFDRDRGWVAYLVPTRTLVNQITRRLRRDFEALDIVVEQVSPALEVDSIESEMLQQHDTELEFRVLVTTPEKLDLMLRQGWEEKIGRPLTLVVVDEAHNIQNTHRGLKLELLLATINNECVHAQFLLLTPFISNAREVAEWLGGPNSDDISLAVDWQPNDRVIGIVQPEKGEVLRGRSFDYRLRMETIQTTRNTLFVDDLLTIPKNTEIASTYSKVSSLTALAAVTAQELHKRGPVIVMHMRPDLVWLLAERLKIESNKLPGPTEKIKLVQDFLRLEFGDSFPLIDLLDYGIGVHHAGLSDDVRALMEWLFEENQLKFLVATTTIAQGVNFPVTGVVMASHQYPYGNDMPPEDFWNIAGRAGRIDQGRLGIVALVAKDPSKADSLRGFVREQVRDLDSALISLANEAGNMLLDLKGIVYRTPEWSTFVQYLTHSYYQMGQPEEFADEIEQIMRSTFGFEKLRNHDSALANRLLEGVHSYTEYLQKPGQPLKLVDSTGFSLQSIREVLSAANKGGFRDSMWNLETIFSPENQDLQGMVGFLFGVPELRESFKTVTGGESPDGEKLALIIKAWVNGDPIPDIARRYFMDEGGDMTAAMTRCGKNLFGNLTNTAAWGLGALLSITGSNLPEDQLESLRNLPSRVYYGVNSDAAIILRLLGVPRSAAAPLAASMDEITQKPLRDVRAHLQSMDRESWIQALGQHEGEVYWKTWRTLEGLD